MKALKKIVALSLLVALFCSDVADVKPAHAESGLWGFLWDLAVDTAIDYAINHADEIVDAVSSAFNDDSSDSSYYSRRIVADVINVREDSDKKSRVLTQLRYGQKLHVHKTAGNNMKWSLVETSDGVQGWVSSDYIAPLNGKGIPVKTKQRVNIRMSPEAKSSWNIIAQIETNTELLMVRRWTVNDRIWFYVQTPSGIMGWVSSKNVE